MTDMTDINITEFLVTDMINNIDGNTIEEKFAFCISCTCCERHSKNRPYLLAPWIPNLLTPQQDTNDDIFGCKCHCRHAARFICRRYTHMQTTSFNTSSISNDTTGVTEDTL